MKKDTLHFNQKKKKKKKKEEGIKKDNTRR
jgi:hypothetical protein